VDQVADLDLGDVGGSLEDLGDHLVAEGHRVAGRAAGVRGDERAQAAVEDLVGKGRGAPVQAELGAVADPTEPGPQPDLTGFQRPRGLLGEPEPARAVEHQGAGHERASFRAYAQPTT